MKRAYLSLLFLAAVFSTYAQDCELYFPDTEGTQLVYNHFDKKGELTSTSKQKVSKVNNLSNGIEVLIEMLMLDDKGEQIHEGELSVVCKNGTFYIDMERYLDQNSMQGFEGMDIQVESDELAFPKDMKAGDVLDDGMVTAKILNNGIKIMTMIVKIYDRKVEAEETITTKAGSFKCFKISQSVETKAGLKVSSKTTEWYSKKTGLIKSENYSSKGKLMGSTELVEINN